MTQFSTRPACCHTNPSLICLDLANPFYPWLVLAAAASAILSAPSAANLSQLDTIHAFESKGETMNTRTIVTGLCCLLLAGAVGTGLADKTPATRQAPSHIELPKPRTEGGMTLNEALAKRRSIRGFTGQTLTRDQISQICWAAQGITHQGNHRTAPSAGATYPLRVYVALPDGVFLYVPDKNGLEPVLPDDIRPAIARNTSNWLASAGAIFVLCGDVSITAAKYRDRKSVV
jgi:hypothetical protein